MSLPLPVSDSSSDDEDYDYDSSSSDSGDFFDDEPAAVHPVPHHLDLSQRETIRGVVLHGEKHLFDPFLDTLYGFGRIRGADALAACERASAFYTSDENRDRNVLRLEAPLTIVGDLHATTSEDSPRYLFLGDYVDRGRNSVRVVLLLLSLAVRFPHNVFLLRGNHEDSMISSTYGFRDECLKRFGEVGGEELWQAVMKAVSSLPLAAVVNGRAFCCHGGIGPHVNLADLSRRYRHHTVVEHGDRILEELLWSDPTDSTVCRPQCGKKGFSRSLLRGLGVLWNEEATRNFLEAHHLEWIVRAHEAVDGCHLSHSGLVVTIFSASHYGKKYDNRAAIMKLDADGKCSIVRFRTKYLKYEDDSLRSSRETRRKKRSEDGVSTLLFRQTLESKRPRARVVKVYDIDTVPVGFQLEKLSDVVEPEETEANASDSDAQAEAGPGASSLRIASHVENFDDPAGLSSSLRFPPLYEADENPAHLARKGRHESSLRGALSSGSLKVLNLARLNLENLELLGDLDDEEG